MTKNIQQAFQVLFKFKELGATDAQNINTIIPELDEEGMVGRDRVIELLFAKRATHQRTQAEERLFE